MLAGPSRDRPQLESAGGEAPIRRQQYVNLRRAAVPVTDMTIKIVSFSYWRGAPPRSAAVVDCRELPNPHSVIALWSLDGRDPHVRQWLMAERFGVWIKLCTAGTLLAEKGHLVACGCIAGQHRSVAVAEMIAEALRAGGREVRVEHTAIW